jgi:hypothetical protein
MHRHFEAGKRKGWHTNNFRIISLDDIQSDQTVELNVARIRSPYTPRKWKRSLSRRRPAPFAIHSLDAHQFTNDLYHAAL